jgi:soluble lytic murein transglycosylase
MALYHDRAHYLDAARDLARAGELFAPGAAETVEAGFHAARALSRADRDPEAAVAYRAFARRHPGTSRADEALYRAAYLEFNASDFRTARASFEKALAAGLREPWKKSAVFCVAFASLRLGDPASAVRWLTQSYPLESADPLVGARGRYWLGVANLDSGRRTDAVAAWRHVLRRFPLDYYALLARQRIESSGENPGPALSGAPPPARRVEVPEPPEPIATLLHVGLVEEAAQEIERREAEIRRDGIERLLAYYERAHAARRTYNLALVNLSALADRPPGGRASRAWELLYPRPYEPELSALERENGLPPNFLYAIMRQESAFDPDEVSSAEAIGLLQMIPPTTRRVAVAMGIEYTDDALFDVHVNLATGARYIGALYRKFGGQLPLVIGSFNAGPRAMARFVDRFGDRPTDEFVELITYDQTRTYVRRVLSALARYRFLYGRDAAAPQAWPLAIDMHIDRRYAPDPDY